MQDLGAVRSQQYPLHQYPEQRGEDHRFQQEPSQTNPCSALFNIIINIGGVPSQAACIQHDPTNPNGVQVNINNAEPASQRSDAILATHDRPTPQNQTGGHVDNTGQMATIQAPIANYRVVGCFQLFHIFSEPHNDIFDFNKNFSHPEPSNARY